MRIAIKISYDGTAYGGWQRQKNAPSIQQCIEEALETVLGTPCHIVGAGRTDAGVHAYGQVAHFETDSRIPPEKFCYVLNQKLPADIRVIESRAAGEDFHARKGAVGKHYRYTVYHAPHASALERNTTMHIPQKLDFEQMQKAASYFEGEHDFSAFRSMGSNIIGTVRRIYKLEVTQNGPHIYMDVWGNGFLYNMVRIIAGTLISVGKGKIAAADIPDIIAAGDRTRAGVTAPAQGLAMCEVFYDDFFLENL